MKFDQQIDYSPQSPGVPFAKAERQTPTGGISQAAIVFALSLGSGFTVFVGTGLLAWGFHWPIRVALIASGAAILGVWAWWLFSGNVEALLWTSETITGLDLNRDGRIGQPTIEQPTITLEITDTNHRRFQYIDLPGTPEALHQLAQGVLSGRTFAEAEWTGAGRPYSRNEFRDLRAKLIERGVLCWRNDKAPAQGVELTRGGKAIFRQLAEVTPSARTHAHARPGYEIAPPDYEE